MWQDALLDEDFKGTGYGGTNVSAKKGLKRLLLIVLAWFLLNIVVTVGIVIVESSRNARIASQHHEQEGEDNDGDSR